MGSHGSGLRRKNWGVSGLQEHSLQAASDGLQTAPDKKGLKQAAELDPRNPNKGLRGYKLNFRATEQAATEQPPPPSQEKARHRLNSKPYITLKIIYHKPEALSPGSTPEKVQGLVVVENPRSPASRL